MRTSKKDRFITIRSEGGLLPLDFLERVALLDQEISGLTPADYHLVEHEKINEAINRAWDRLLGCWVSFKSAMRNASEDDPLIRETRERWLLPLFDALGYGRLTTCKSIELDGRNFQLSHMWQKVPLHLVGFNVELDRRTAGVAGAAKSAPHGMVQDFLNHSDDHLWAFVSNGRKLRILRDNVSLTRQAFVEFDLEGMMDGEQFSDFRVLYLLCHQSRVEQEKSQDFWLEQWTSSAQLSGVRVREELGKGVEEAISVLGTGFLQHPSNVELRNKLKSGKLSAQEYYRQILRTVYRLLFLFVAEDRGALLRRESSIEARNTYADYYSTQRIREMAGTRKGSHHHDLWQRQALVFNGLEKGCSELALPALGSFLWSSQSIKDIAQCDLFNRNFLSAVFSLAFTEEGKSKRAVDFKNLRTEELGSVYEALLEMHPQVDLGSNKFGLFGASGSERKKTGSYYTPASIVACLIDSAMNPVIHRISKRTNAKDLLLNIKICDPACGSGHFLLAAANRLARALAAARSEDEEPSPEAYRIAFRDVISHCIYGVDLNEMSVELCKVSLWLESVDPERPLSFLDSKIKCGNSLVGATPSLIARGIPDEAFDPIEGDDKVYAKQIKKANKEQSQGQLHISILDRKSEYRNLSNEIAKVESIEENSLQSVKNKEKNYSELTNSDQYKTERLLCDAWCAAFLWPLNPGAPQPLTRSLFALAATDWQRLPPDLQSEVEKLHSQYRFFHWHLEFPEVFFRQNDSKDNSSHCGWNKGFDIVLGNPPWERIKLQRDEWFAARVPEIGSAQSSTERDRLINELRVTNKEVIEEYEKELRKSEGESHFIRKSGRFPLAGRGDINTYSIFAETIKDLLDSSGFAGFVAPSGLATDDTTKVLFQDLVQGGLLRSFYDFENRRGIFPGVHRSYKFALTTLAGEGNGLDDSGTDFVFFALGVADLSAEDKHFRLSLTDIETINPDTKTCATFRTRFERDFTIACYRRLSVLGASDAGWNLTIRRIFDINKKDILSLCSRTNESKDRVPMYEAKLFHQYDHRFASYAGTKVSDIKTEQKRTPDDIVVSKYWVEPRDVVNRLPVPWNFKWFLVWRDIARSTDERTVISSIIPFAATDFTVRVGFLNESTAEEHAYLLSLFNSMAFDFFARQKVAGTHLSDYILKQLPVVPKRIYKEPCPWEKDKTLGEWIIDRVLPLVATSAGVHSFEIDCGLEASSRGWDEESRWSLRNELDAAYFVLFGLSDAEITFVLDSFPVLKKKEESSFGVYKTSFKIIELVASYKALSKQQLSGLKL